MEYKALYRKYRPDTFSDVVGQEVITTILKNSIIKNKISHAYLFTGPRGCGKTSIAKIYAKAINCLNPKDGNPCNECQSCKYLTANGEDIIEFDAASNNGVDEIREIRNKVNLATSVCNYKVYIIDEVHMLSISAFNALLKTLEEPPKHVVFILATTDPQKIPSTVISRCQRFELGKLSNKEISDLIIKISKAESVVISEESANEIAFCSDGCIRDAISLLDQVISFSGNKITISEVNKVSYSISWEIIYNLIAALCNGDLENIFVLLKTLEEDNRDYSKVMEKIVIALRNILLYKKAKSYYESLGNNLDDVKKFDDVDIDYIQSLLRAACYESKNINQANNKNIAVDVFLINNMNKRIGPKYIYCPLGNNLSENEFRKKNALINNLLLEGNKACREEFLENIKGVEGSETDKKWNVSIVSEKSILIVCKNEDDIISSVNLFKNTFGKAINDRHLISITDKEFTLVQKNYINMKKRLTILEEE